MNDTITTPDPGATPPPMTAAELATIALGTPTPPDPAVGTPTPMEPAPGESSSPSPPATADGTPAEPAPPVERKSTVERRIDTLVAEKHAARAAAAEADRRARLAEETLVELKRLAATTHPGEGETPALAPSGTTEPTYTAADLQRQAAAVAREMEFNRACNEAVTTGRAAHADFDKSLDALKTVTPVMPQMFVEAALETGKAPDILHALGQDLNEYDRIISLPPLKQAVELTRYAAKLEAKTTPAAPTVPVPAPRAAAVPAPISPRVGTGNGSVRTDVSPDDPKSDEIPSAEWFRRREAQIEAARKARGRR